MTTRVAAELPHSKSLRSGEIYGFIAGDGSLGKYDNEISFVNSDRHCIERVVNNFSVVFGIEKEKFHYYLAIPSASAESDAVAYWTGSLGEFNPVIRKYEKVKKQYGHLRVFLSDKKLKNEIKYRILKILDGEEQDREILLGFLRGFFAAEGAIIPGKTRREIPNSVQFPQKGRRIPESVSRILCHFRVENRVVIKQKKADYYCVNITGYENFKKLHDLGIADLHPEKKVKLENGLKAYKKIISRKLKLPVKLLKALDKKPMTRTEIYEIMESYPQKINSMLYSKKSYLVKNKLLAKQFFDDGTILWRLTEAGRYFLRGQE